MTHSTEILDLSGLACPMPLLKAKLALKGLSMGEILQVVSTDASSIIDFNVFARQTPHQLLKWTKEADKYIFWVKKGE